MDIEWSGIGAILSMGQVTKVRAEQVSGLRRHSNGLSDIGVGLAQLGGIVVVD